MATSLIQRIAARVEAEGPAGVARALARRVMAPRLRCYSEILPYFAGRIGLEIGGPSSFFARRGYFPVYPVVARVDNCNFSRNTVWEGSIQDGRSFRYDGRHAPGRQYIAEATSLSQIESGVYDFILSSHTLEHVANPLAALLEWKRVLKRGGILVLVVPHKECTFDHRRPVTSMEHLVHDYYRQTPESDQTHLEEILRLHDLSRDPGSAGFDAFRVRAERNLENRTLHHHVFDTELAVEIVHRIGLQVRSVEPVRPYHIVVVAEQVSHVPNNDIFRGSQAVYRRSSPFDGDRVRKSWSPARESINEWASLVHSTGQIMIERAKVLGYGSQ